MKNMSLPKFLLSMSLLALLSNCTPKPPDVPVCEHLASYLATDAATGHLILKPSPTCMKQVGEAECGHCTTIMTGTEFYVGEDKAHWFNAKPWSQLRAESVLVPAIESYAPIATYMINSCKKAGCSDQVDRFKVKIDAVNPTALGVQTEQ